MNVDRKQFIKLEARVGGKVTLRENGTKKSHRFRYDWLFQKNYHWECFTRRYARHNLQTISQLCDKGFDIMYLSTTCLISLNGKCFLASKQINNVYMVDLNCIEYSNSLCLKIVAYKSLVLHRRLCQASLNKLWTIIQKELVKVMLKL